MDRALHQITVLATSACLLIITLSAGFSSTQNSHVAEFEQPATKISNNLTH